MRGFSRLLLIAAAVAAFFLFAQARRFSQAQGAVPAGVTLGGVAVSGQTVDEVAAALTAAFQQPVAVYYGEQRVLLRPESIGFKVDARAMLAEAEQYRGGWHFVAAFLGALAGRPTPVADVPLRYTLDEAALSRWLTDLAARYDRPPRPPQGLLATLSFSPGEPGLQLDVKASLPIVRRALAATGERRADLVLVKKPAPPPTIAVLGELLKAQAEEFPGVASIFVRDVARGEEVGVEPEIAFAGMSTMKIPILVETYRHLDGPPDAEMTKLLTETISLSGNFTANLLLAFIGQGSAERGARAVSDTLRRLGLHNTFMVAPYDWKQPVKAPSTPANSRRDITTYPDPSMQTTAKDMALLMEMILQCSEGQGALLAAFPDELTPAECQEMIALLESDRLGALIQAGVPATARVAHKHGFIDDSHGDVAIIWGPQGPYVLSIFLYRPKWLEWELSNGTMQAIAKATWAYFDFLASTGSGSVEQGSQAAGPAP